MDQRTVDSAEIRCDTISQGIHTVALPGMNSVNSRDRTPTVMAGPARLADNPDGSPKLSPSSLSHPIDYMAWAESESEVSKLRLAEQTACMLQSSRRVVSGCEERRKVEAAALRSSVRISIRAICVHLRPESSCENEIHC
jgi:hypothetical protein